MSFTDPWAIVVAWLQEPATGASYSESGPTQPMHWIRHEADGATPHGIQPEIAQKRSTPKKSVIVTLVERFSAKAVSITWRDSTAANYCEQRWVRRVARSPGICALTGATIARGDAVYRPVNRAVRRPTNYSQMVLAQALDDLG